MKVKYETETQLLVSDRSSENPSTQLIFFAYVMR